MMTRRGRDTSWRLVIACAMTVSGCAGVSNTPGQDLAYARWAACAPVSNLVSIDRVEPDGRIWFSYYVESDRQQIVTCLQKAGQGGPSLPSPVGVLRGRGGA